jgi:hypothetical protein
MKKPTIIIGLLGSPKGEMKEADGLLESDMPEALADAGLNRANKANAVLKANYGPSEDKMRYCGNCEYFNTELPSIKKGEGFCEVWEFKCSEKNLCAAWEFAKPEEEEED